jgi:hypothetical protein
VLFKQQFNLTTTHNQPSMATTQHTTSGVLATARANLLHIQQQTLLCESCYATSWSAKLSKLCTTVTHTTTNKLAKQSA